jgi:hypothetical protein
MARQIWLRRRGIPDAGPAATAEEGEERCTRKQCVACLKPGHVQKLQELLSGRPVSTSTIRAPRSMAETDKARRVRRQHGCPLGLEMVAMNGVSTGNLRT